MVGVQINQKHKKIMATITKTEYYQKIEQKLLDSMKSLDESVMLMNQLYHENHKEASEALKIKKDIKKLLNKKFDAQARKN